MAVQYTPNLGGTPDDHAARDAIHVAVVPVVAAKRMVPGEKTGLDAKGKADPSIKPMIGVVDPFRANCVEPGESFWLCMFPNTVTNLRHAWAHPAFPTPESETHADKTLSEAWLREYAKKVKPYQEPEDAYRNLLKDLRDNSLNFDGHEAHSLDEVENKGELVYHGSMVIGKPIDIENLFVSCGC